MDANGNDPGVTAKAPKVRSLWPPSLFGKSRGLRRSLDCLRALRTIFCEHARSQVKKSAANGARRGRRCANCFKQVIGEVA